MPWYPNNMKSWRFIVVHMTNPSWTEGQGGHSGTLLAVVTWSLWLKTCCHLECWNGTGPWSKEREKGAPLAGFSLSPPPSDSHHLSLTAHRHSWRHGHTPLEMAGNCRGVQWASDSIIVESCWLCHRQWNISALDSTGHGQPSGLEAAGGTVAVSGSLLCFPG